MKIRDVAVSDVIAGRNWRLKGRDEYDSDIVEWEIEECDTFRATDTVVYSVLSAFRDAQIRPTLLVREVGTCEWWGDTCEYTDGAWAALRQSKDPDQWSAETYVAMPLSEDPSFMGEYSHEKQRAGFERLRKRILLAD